MDKAGTSLVKRSTGVVSALLGVFCLFIGFMEVSGVQRNLMVDRWRFFVEEEGVRERQQASAIANRLAADAQSLGWLHVASGLTLVMGAGSLLGWTRKPVADPSSP